jgi:prevent-host-death family protein
MCLPASLLASEWPLSRWALLSVWVRFRTPTVRLCPGICQQWGDGCPSRDPWPGSDSDLDLTPGDLRVDYKKTIFGLILIFWKEAMRYSSQVKPISYLKANAAEVLTQLAEQREPMVITQNGEAKAVLQDLASFEETQETLALLKILALGNQEIAVGRVKPVADVVARLRAKRIPT